MFQYKLFEEIRTLVAWLKSTFLLKIKCRDTHIYIKAECLQTKWDAALFCKGKDRVVLIKSLIYARVWKMHLEGHTIKDLRKVDQSRSKM